MTVVERVMEILDEKNSQACACVRIKKKKNCFTQTKLSEGGLDLIWDLG
jgi:hypothetical protein